MKRRLFLCLPVLLIAFFVFLAAGCTPAGKNGQALLSAEHVRSFSPEELQAQAEQPPYTPFSGSFRSGVEVYRVSYRTEYPAGTPLTVSGLFFLPAQPDPAAPTVAYMHGTVPKGQAPTLCAGDPGKYNYDLWLCTMAAGACGGTVLVPDYIGYGVSDDVSHPYNHAESMARSGLDLIRAYKEFAAGEGRPPFDGKVAVAGYSEGGYGAVALHRALQELSGQGFRVVKTVAGSGPYDNVAFARELLEKDEQLDPIHISTYLWVLQMYKTDYGYSKPYEEIFSASDDSVFRANGYQLGYLIPSALPIDCNPTRLFRPDFTRAVSEGADKEFSAILQKNSLTDFAPCDSLIFVCGSADNFVYPENTANAYAAMRAKGCPVSVHEMPGGDHGTTYGLYLQVVLNSLRAR